MNKKMSLIGLVSFMLIIGIMFASCGKTGKSPSNVVKQFYTAMEKDDKDALNEALTPETMQTFSMFHEKIKGALVENGKIAKTEETINGETAVVKVTYENGETESYDLVKRDGKWKIHQTK
jgi:ketosteroid isomerase-like protein